MKPFAGTVDEFFAGDGLFETLLVERGRIAFADAHLARLRASAAELGFGQLEPDARILEGLRAYLESEDLVETGIRLNLRLDRSGLSHLARPVDSSVADARARGVAVITVRLEHDRRGRARHKWVERKTLRSAMQRARAAGPAEALLIAPDGCLLEGATSNVFCLSDGRLRTPPTDSRILPGVTRSAIQEIARELEIEVDESAVDEATLRSADEVFITSAVRMLVPVVEIDGQPVGNGTSGPMASRLAPLLWQRAFGEG